MQEDSKPSLSRSRRSNPEPDFFKWGRQLLFLLKLAAAAIAVFIIAALIFIIYLRSQPLPPSTTSLTTVMYDQNGHVIDTLHGGENRDSVPLSEMPDYVKEATLSIEDHTFYEHHGFYLKGIMRAMLVNLKALDIIQGASTITQQLAENLYLSHDRTWSIKFKEAIYTIQLELQFSKDDILEKYLNEIYFGHSAFGVESASHIFFGKPVTELNLAESAMLAGIPKGPKFYSPHMSFEGAKTRQKTVLQAMVDNGYITEAEADAALKEEIHLVPLKPAVSEAPYFTDYIASTAARRYGISPEAIQQGGLRIYTTLDLELQKYAETLLAETLPEGNNLQGAIVVMDPHTGYVQAMVGGKNYKSSQYNRVFAKRQPGSSFKPFVYLSALENGKTAASMIESKPKVFHYDNNQTYIPQNFSQRYANDEITMRYAIAHSDNIYAVETHLTVGAEKTVEMANRLGINSNLSPIPSLALGSEEVSPFEMAAAYSAIANGGKRIEPLAILRIEDSDGNILVEEKPTVEQVVDPAYTFILTDLMRSVFEPGGTGYRVNMKIKNPVAGKTGSTDYDSWVMGFSPNTVTGVWIGYDKGQKLNSADSVISKNIWNKLMTFAHESGPPALFSIPKGVTGIMVDQDTGMVATASCPNTRLEYFVSGTQPKQTCTDHPHHIEEKPSKKKEKNESFWKRFKFW